MRVLAYSGNIAVINEIKEKLAGKDVTTTRQKDKFLEFAYSKDYDVVCVDIWDADKEARELLGAGCNISPINIWYSKMPKNL